MMIRITDTPKPRDRFSSIPIREGKQANNSLHGPHLPRRPKKSFLWTWLKRIVVLLFVMALLLGIVSPLLVPYLFTTRLAKHLAATLNRPVTIASGEFNPLTSTLILRQLIIGPNLSNPDDPVDPLLSAGKISLTLDPKRLLHGEVACTLGAEHFFLHLVRKQDGGYNLGQALDGLLPSLPVLPLRFFCDAIAMSNSRLVFDDEQTGRAHQAEELTLAIPPGPPSPMRLQATINGVPITLPDTANDPATSADLSVKTAEAIALVQNLDQAARQYLQQTVNQPATRRTSLTP